MQTLTWTNGHCTNPPGDWQIVVHECGVDGWVYEASLISRGDDGWDTVHAKHRQDGYPTERAAQLACEALLWRIGLLPLPEWHALSDGTHLLRHPNEGFDCVTRCWRLGDRWTFDGGGIWQGKPTTLLDAAKSAAERHLRCEIAAALDAEAAKEGAE